MCAWSITATVSAPLESSATMGTSCMEMAACVILRAVGKKMAGGVSPEPLLQKVPNQTSALRDTETAFATETKNATTAMSNLWMDAMPSASSKTDLYVLAGLSRRPTRVLKSTEMEGVLAESSATMRTSRTETDVHLAYLL
jgi:hypothetical protein